MRANSQRFCLDTYALKRNSFSSSSVWYLEYGFLFLRTVTWPVHSSGFVGVQEPTAPTPTDNVEPARGERDKRLIHSLNLQSTNGMEHPISLMEHPHTPPLSTPQSPCRDPELDFVAKFTQNMTHCVCVWVEWGTRSVGDSGGMLPPKLVSFLLV